MCLAEDGAWEMRPVEAGAFEMRPARAPARDTGCSEHSSHGERQCCDDHGDDRERSLNIGCRRALAVACCLVVRCWDAIAHEGAEGRFLSPRR
jgi:hypothetical protein